MNAQLKKFMLFLLLGDGVRKWVTLSHAAVVVAVLVAGVVQSWLRPKFVITPVRMIEISPRNNDSGHSTARATDDTPTVSEPITPSVADADSSSAPAPPVVAKSKWQARTIEQIRKDALRPVADSRTSQNPTSIRTQTTMPEIDVGGIADRLKSTVAKVNVTPVQSSGVGRSAGRTSSAVGKYTNAISSVLHQKWNQPSASLVAESDRMVEIELVIGADGRILKSRIIRPSNNSVMNRSVLAIFKSTRRLPAPTAYGLGGNQFATNIVFLLE